MERKQQTGVTADTAIEQSLMKDSNDASQANLAMEREFYDRDPETSPAEAVDVPEIFGNQS